MKSVEYTPQILCNLDCNVGVYQSRQYFNNFYTAQLADLAHWEQLLEAIPVLQFSIIMAIFLTLIF